MTASFQSPAEAVTLIEGLVDHLRNQRERLRERFSEFVRVPEAATFSALERALGSFHPATLVQSQIELGRLTWIVVCDYADLLVRAAEPVLALAKDYAAAWERAAFKEAVSDLKEIRHVLEGLLKQVLDLVTASGNLSSNSVGLLSRHRQSVRLQRLNREMFL